MNSRIGALVFAFCGLFSSLFHPFYPSFIHTLLPSPLLPFPPSHYPHSSPPLPIPTFPFPHFSPPPHFPPSLIHTPLPHPTSHFHLPLSTLLSPTPLPIPTFPYPHSSPPPHFPFPPSFIDTPLLPSPHTPLVAISRAFQRRQMS